jgi:glycosyltransferase involved in cell wall biosynthesis
MKIAIVVSDYSLGGAESHALKLAKFFKQVKHFEVEYWVFSEGDGTTKSICLEYGIETRKLTEFKSFKKFPFNVRDIGHYVKSVRQFKPDVILSFNVLPNIWNGIISRFSGVKLSVWSQQSEINYGFQNPLEKFALKKIGCFLSNAHHASNKLQEILPVKRSVSDFHVVHNGISEQIPKNSQEFWEEKLNRKNVDFIATMVANLTITKDHETLIKAWDLVVKENQDKKILLALAGRKGEKTELIEGLIKSYELEDSVMILGPVNDIPGLNKASDIGVLSSKAEGLPNSIMEQMILGKPVVGTANDGIKEVVGEEMIQYLSPIEDYRDLADKINLFISDEDLTNRIGEMSRKRICNQFSLDKMNNDTLSVIESYL